MNDKKYTVLIVEDFNSIREIIGNTLEINGYNVRKASSGVGALRLLKEEGASIDVILSDYNMPKMDGMELLRALRSDQDPSLSAIPFLFLTSEKDPDKMRAAKALGLNAWIKKPFQTNSFLAQLEHCLLATT